MKDLLTPNLTALTPHNLLADQNISSIAKAIDPQLTQISASAFEAMILPQIDTLPEQTLDLLAWQMHVDFYDLAYSLDIKRRAVKGSLLWHMKKGTVAAIIEALNLIDIDAKFIHWKDIPDGEGKPYTFNITAIVAGDFYRTRGKDRLASSIRRAVNDAKAERSYMAKLDIHIEPKEQMHLFTGTLWVRNWDINLGLEKTLMHELLLLFERRILDKLVSYGERFTEKMTSFSLDLTAKLAAHEKAIVERVDEYEDNTAQRIQTCEEETARRIHACEETTSMRIQQCEDEVGSRIDACEMQTARSIAHCEAETARLIQECDEATSTRIAGYIMRVDAYEEHASQYFEEIALQVRELRRILTWVGAEPDADEKLLNPKTM